MCQVWVLSHLRNMTLTWGTWKMRSHVLCQERKGKTQVGQRTSGKALQGLQDKGLAPWPGAQLPSGSVSRQCHQPHSHCSSPGVNRMLTVRSGQVYPGLPHGQGGALGDKHTHRLGPSGSKGAAFFIPESAIHELSAAQGQVGICWPKAALWRKGTAGSH